MVSHSTNEAKKDFSLSSKDFNFIADLTYKNTGIVLTESKHDLVYGRLSRRIRALGLDDFSDYCEMLRTPKGEDELGFLINSLTTNLTRFFRENHHFEHFYEYLEKLAKEKPSRLRFWSAGCSAGMEPYSMAMVLKRALANMPACDAKILATDIDTDILQKGIQGTYQTTDLEDLPSPYSRYIQPTADPTVASMKDEIKNLITFKPLNLLEGWPMRGQFDAVFCRNVVIYFDSETKYAIFRRMLDMIKVGGFLYIGHSETMKDVDGFKALGHTIYQRVSV